MTLPSDHAAADQQAAESASPPEPTEPDPACAGAVDLASAAAVEVAGDTVGDHVGAVAEPAGDDEHVVTHSFDATLPGYVGWCWAVTVARASGSETVTVDEVVLLPGSGALLAPGWVPWSDRVQPGDLGPGDLLPPAEHDPRLVPSHEDVDADALPHDLHRDLGLDRARVLSLEGRFDAAERWWEGESGPRSPLARQAPGRCADCGFLVPVSGALGRSFGACANGVAPDDGRVVALLHGCGAHSETVMTAGHANTTALAVEHDELEVIDVAALPEPAGDGDGMAAMAAMAVAMAVAVPSRRLLSRVRRRADRWLRERRADRELRERAGTDTWLLVSDTGAPPCW